MENIIEVKQASYSYPGETEGLKAVDRVDLTVSRGEFVVIIGHNGSGKSTLAKMLNAILVPDEGEVRVNGMDTREEADLWEIRRNAGMVFQNPDNQLVATLVEEDVAFGPENLGIDPGEIRTRVDRALSVVGMEDYKRKPPHLLSGGQKQRIAIAGILAMKPACIILDEPTAMLDPSGRKEVLETIQRLNRQEGITIIHITHFMEEAAQADRVLVMDEGKMVMEGPPREIFASQKLLARYGLDLPQVTLLANSLREEGLPLAEGVLTLDEMVEELCRLL